MTDHSKSATQASLLAELTALPRAQRFLVGIAGAPGAGKSTLAGALAEDLNAASPGRAAVLGMDGYHFDDLVLNARGHRARKGAPHTFDVGGLASCLARVRMGEEVAVPVFDRSIEIARAGAAIIPTEVEVVLVEGNYILTDQGPWAILKDAFDLRVMVDVSEAELTRRLTARWVGYDLTEAEIATKLNDNDLPNGAYVRDHSVQIDRVISEG